MRWVFCWDSFFIKSSIVFFLCVVALAFVGSTMRRSLSHEYDVTFCVVEVVTLASNNAIEAITIL